MEPVKKRSRKRDAIIALLGGTTAHPNAEWIYSQLKPIFPDLSLGTVYRNLAGFKEEGVIISVATVRGQERYDADTSRHAHFICDVCGAVIDIKADFPLDNFIETAEKETGALVTGADLKFHGTCADCAGNQK